jgi:hypothetical protein
MEKRAREGGLDGIASSYEQEAAWADQRAGAIRRVVVEPEPI